MCSVNCVTEHLRAAATSEDAELMSLHVFLCEFGIILWDGWSIFYGLTPATAEARGVYLVSYVCLIPVNVISQEVLQGNFFKLGTNVFLDLWMNWLDVGGQRSKVRVTLALALSRSRDHHILGTPEGNRSIAGSFSGMEQWSMSWTGGLDTGPSCWRRIWTGRWRSQFTNPTLTCGHELWVVTQRTRWWIQVDEMSVRLMVAGLGLEPQLHWWFWHLIRISPGRLPLEVLWRPLGRPRILWGDYTSHLAWECLGITWKTSGIPECHRDLTPDKWKTMDGVQYWPEDRSCSGLCW